MMLTFDILHAIMPKANAPVWAPALEAAMGEYGIDTAQRAAMFLANVALESRELTAMRENLNYSTERLLVVFPKYFNPGTALTYARNPQRIANRVYANRMGNGDEASGDGWKYRGGGPPQLTGRAAYAKAGAALALALEASPEMIAAPMVGARVAAWFWHDKDMNTPADADDFRTVVLRWNGGTNGLPEREAYWRRAKQALGA